MKKYPVEIYFRFYNCENSTIKLLYNGKECVPKNTFYIHQQEISLPSNLKFEMIGKHFLRADTKVDEKGQLTFDRYIKIVKVTVKDLLPNKMFLEKLPEMHVGSKSKHFARSNQMIHTNYMGFNGVVNLQFEGNTPGNWIMKSHRYKSIDWNDDTALHLSLFVA